MAYHGVQPHKYTVSGARYAIVKQKSPVFGLSRGYIMADYITDFFKGRIGQAILESTLLHFGYRVERLACQVTPVLDSREFENVDFLPDLMVTAPDSEEKTYLEVKLQPSHPLGVRIPKTQITILKRDYPDTWLVYVSAYNGSINCLSVNDPVISDENLDDEDCYRINLLAEEWKPLWDLFPKVEKSDKTDALWYEMKSVLSDFAANRLSGSKNTGFFAEERDSLKQYLGKHWHPGMLVQDIKQLNVETAGIEEIWERAIAVHAFRFAFELCGGEANMDHPAFSQIMDKMRGRTGERLITIPYQNIQETLTEYPDLYKKLQELEETVRKTSPYDAGVVLMEGLLEIIPPGIGSAFVLPEQGAKDEPIEVDLRTLLVLMQRRNCLYD